MLLPEVRDNGDHIPGRLFVGMGCFQGNNSRLDIVRMTDHLNLVLNQFLQLAGRSDAGFTASPWQELPFPGHLPAAALILPDATGTGGKQGILDHLQMALGYIKV